MHELRLAHWSITTRLVVIASVPALLLFLFITVALYLGGREEAQRTVLERGSLIATSLAQTGQYGLVSGNSASLERSIQRLVETDSTIASIELRTADGRPIASAVAADRDAAIVFEREIRAEVFGLDLLDNSSTATEGKDMVIAGAGPLIGTLTVRMSIEPILRDRLASVTEVAVVALITTLVSVFAGLVLAHRLREPLRAVVSALRAIRQGRLDVVFTAPAQGELGELQEAITEMARTLSARREELEALVDSRTADLEAAMARVRSADAERRRLLNRSNQQLEDERKRIAVEIHDHLNASLIGLRAKVQHIAEVAAGMPGPAAREVHAMANDITGTIAALYQSARDLIKQLRPEVIDVLGLAGALSEMAREYGRLVPGVSFELQVSPGFPSMKGEVAIVAYRLVQEALSNVVKHAEAGQVAIALRTSRTRSGFFVAVRDDGIGFDPRAVPGGSLGLAGMRERVSGAGGRMRLISEPGNGALVAFRLPEPEAVPFSARDGPASIR